MRAIIVAMLLLAALCVCGEAGAPPASAARLPSVLQLSGRVDDCCCDAETVDHYNNGPLLSVLNNLTKTEFFKGVWDVPVHRASRSLTHAHTVRWCRYRVCTCVYF